MNVYEWCNLLKIAVLMYELLPILCNSLKKILILHLLIKQPPSVIFLVSLWRLLKTRAQVCWNVWASFGTVNSNVSNNFKVQAKRCCLTELQIHVGQPVSVMQGLYSKACQMVVMALWNRETFPCKYVFFIGIASWD